MQEPPIRAGVTAPGPTRPATVHIRLPPRRFLPPPNTVPNGNESSSSKEIPDPLRLLMEIPGLIDRTMDTRGPPVVVVLSCVTVAPEVVIVQNPRRHRPISTMIATEEEEEETREATEIGTDLAR